MNRNTVKTLSLLAVLALATAASYAQQLSVMANVPFDFTVGKKTLPAGEYMIQRLTPSTLIVSNRDNGFSTLLLPQPLSSNLAGSTPRLIFERNNGQSALSEIWAYSDGYKVPVSKRSFSEAQNPAEITPVRVSLPSAR